MKCPKCGSERIATTCVLWAFCTHHCLDCDYTWSEMKIPELLALIGATLFGAAGAFWLAKSKKA